MKDTIMWAIVDNATNEIVVVGGHLLVYKTREQARQAKDGQNEKAVKVLIRKY